MESLGSTDNEWIDQLSVEEHGSPQQDECHQRQQEEQGEGNCQPGLVRAQHRREDVLVVRLVTQITVVAKGTPANEREREEKDWLCQEMTDKKSRKEREIFKKRKERKGKERETLWEVVSWRKCASYVCLSVRLLLTIRTEVVKTEKAINEVEIWLSGNWKIKIALQT